MRAFLAIEIPKEVRALLVRVQEELRRAGADVKWVEPENLHLSLKFLGELSEDAVEGLRERVAPELAAWPALSLTYAGVGSFPERGVPRVLWAGATGEIDRLAALALALERAAETVGVPREGRPFVAHLTLGRVKSARNVKRLQALMEPQRQVPLGSGLVREVVLYRSTLTSEGPLYEGIARFPLRSG
jgi:2'-5' RNA ligase